MDWADIDRNDRTVRRFFNEAQDFKIGVNGLSIPIRGRHHEFALFSVTADMREAEWRIQKPRLMRDLMLMSYHFHDWTLKTAGVDGAENLLDRLSTREKDCLRWRALGKSDWEISQVLTISERTVKFHLENARGKLRAANTTHAVTKALTLVWSRSPDPCPNGQVSIMAKHSTSEPGDLPGHRRLDMIRFVQGKDRHLFQKEIHAYHRLRKRVFHDRMGWQVPLINDWEVDGYDVLDPLYLLSMDDYGRVLGGVRLLPTMGFNMLNDTFPQLLPEGKRVESPLIWESSRFAVDLDADHKVGPRGISRATAELILGMNEVGRSIGLTHIVTVYDIFMRRLLLRAGCAGEPISEPQRIGKVIAYAVFVEVGDEVDRAMREASGIQGNVLEAAPAPLALAA